MTKRLQPKADGVRAAARTLGRTGGRRRLTDHERALSGARPYRDARARGGEPRPQFDRAAVAGIVELVLGEPLPDGSDLEALGRVASCSSRAWWRRIWEAHGDRILRAWIRERPGTRPPLWWAHVAPGRRARRRLNGESRPENETFAAFLERVRRPVEFLHEAEAAFLRRHGLLTAGEARRLRAEEYEPMVFATRDELTEDYCVDPEVLAEASRPA